MLRAGYPALRVLLATLCKRILDQVGETYSDEDDPPAEAALCGLISPP